MVNSFCTSARLHVYALLVPVPAATAEPAQLTSSKGAYCGGILKSVCIFCASLTVKSMLNGDKQCDHICISGGDMREV